MKNPTHMGNLYFITFIDDYSRKAYVYFLRHKNEAFEKFQEFRNYVENQTGLRIKTLRSDRGGEYINGPFKDYLKKYGIRHQLTAPYTPQQNGIAERFNRTVIEMARTMMHSANLPYIFWAEAVYTATYIRNRCISKALDSRNVTPEEIWTGQKPDVSHLRTFGCDAYTLIKDQRHKLEPKAEKCILVGYSADSKAYRLWNYDKNRLIISRDVKFNEKRAEITITHEPSARIYPLDNPSDKNDENDGNQTDEDEETISKTTSTDDSIIYVEREKPKPTKRTRNELKSSLGSYWENPNSETNSNRISYAYAYATACTFIEPQTYDEAISSDQSTQWKNAMKEEYNSLIENRTWNLTELPKGHNLIDVRWLYKIKQNPDGTIERFKARLVAKGYSQHYGIDYDETYSPVYKLASLRTILSIGATLDLEIHQMDVKTAFLNGEIDTEIYIRQPPGFEKRGNLVCRLNKGIYGLKQSPRLWNKKIDDFLTIEQGFS
jgi:hypothetical protein